MIHKLWIINYGGENALSASLRLLWFIWNGIHSDVGTLSFKWNWNIFIFQNSVKLFLCFFIIKTTYNGLIWRVLIQFPRALGPDSFGAFSYFVISESKLERSRCACLRGNTKIKIYKILKVWIKTFDLDRWPETI